MVQADVARLVEVYRRSGRFDIRVEPKIIELPNNRVDLVFEITEGGKTGVKSINFVGNRYYSVIPAQGCHQDLAIRTFCPFCSPTDIYDPDRLEADRELLRRFYLKHGFIDVRIVSAVGEFDPDRRGFVVTFTIEEGEQYRVGAVEVQSTVRALDPSLLRRKLRVFAGDVYNAEAVEKSVEDMTIEAARQGFAFVDRAAACCAQQSEREPSTSSSSSRRGRASMSSGSTSGATRAPGTT